MKLNVECLNVDDRNEIVVMTFDQFLKAAQEAYEQGQADSEDCEAWLNDIPTPEVKKEHYMIHNGQRKPMSQDLYNEVKKWFEVV